MYFRRTVWILALFAVLEWWIWTRIFCISDSGARPPVFLVIPAVRLKRHEQFLLYRCYLIQKLLCSWWNCTIVSILRWETLMLLILHQIPLPKADGCQRLHNTLSHWVYITRKPFGLRCILVLSSCLQRLHVTTYSCTLDSQIWDTTIQRAVN